MRRICFFLVALVLFVGCNVAPVAEPKPPPLQKPPVYRKGDIVVIEEISPVGIIITVGFDKNTRKWVHDVMFKDESLKYDEEHIRLLERFDWNRQPKVQAETTEIPAL